MNRHIIHLLIAQAVAHLACIAGVVLGARWVLALVLAALASCQVGCGASSRGHLGALACSVARAACAICDAKERAAANHEHSADGALDDISNEGTP